MAGIQSTSPGGFQRAPAPYERDVVGRLGQTPRGLGTETSPSETVRVLIADDDKGVSASLAAMVAHCRHEVVEVVGSGLEAIQAYTRHHPDVVLMDYRMSRLNGATACRNILARDPSARVILISGFSHEDDAMSAGAIAVLPKPVKLHGLEAALATAAS